MDGEAIFYMEINVIVGMYMPELKKYFNIQGMDDGTTGSRSSGLCCTNLGVMVQFCLS